MYAEEKVYQGECIVRGMYIEGMCTWGIVELLNGGLLAVDCCHA